MYFRVDSSKGFDNSLKQRLDKFFIMLKDKNIVLVHNDPEMKKYLELILNKNILKI